MGQALNVETKLPASEFQTELMTPEAFEKYWPEISRQLDFVPHIWGRYYTKEYLYCAGLNGDFDVWGVGTPKDIHLVVFSKILVYPASRILQLCLAIGNNIEKCAPVLTATLEKYANEAGCDYCEIVGRGGWEKLLPGFVRKEVILSRSLEHFKVQ